MDLFIYLHGASYVHATENNLYLWVWHGGSCFDLYNLNGDCVDTFTLYGIENPAQAKRAIEDHIKQNQEAS
jgi:hypothetical protein